jgi:DNA-binding transcriptional ArsR family regulator
MIDTLRHVRTVVHPPVEDITLVGVLAALAHPIRLEITGTLAGGGEYVQSDFPVGVSQSTLSHHMKTLRDAGIAFSRPEGTVCFVSLRPELATRFPELLATILDAARATDE